MPDKAFAASIESLIKAKDYRAALSRLKKASGKAALDGDLLYMTSVSYMKMALAEKNPAFLKMAENNARKAIEQDPVNERYHDVLIDIKNISHSLHELSSEYKEKLAETGEEIYERLLSKIAAFTLMSMPGSRKTKKMSLKRKVFYYSILVSCTFQLVSVWFIKGLAHMRLLSALLFAAMIALLYRRYLQSIQENGW